MSRGGGGPTFWKMHGLGNDYVYLDLGRTEVADPPALARRVADRHTGVGSDGLILIDRVDGPDADVSMRMWNADGSEAEMCGNGLRCVAALARELGLLDRSTGRVGTLAGVREVTVEETGGGTWRVRTTMGEPGRTRAEIPMTPGEPDPPVEARVEVDDRSVRLTCVSMGNPHAVLFVDDVAEAPVETLGPLLERHPAFPERVNVGFARVAARDAIRLRVFERGAGETRACGTGAAAALVAAALTDRTDRRATVRLPGGDLEIAWPEGGEVEMTGPAVLVYEGSFDPSWVGDLARPG